jgi:AraC-like DNA-binding protein/ligand-binding sensor protein
MEQTCLESEVFDMKLAVECSDAFSNSTGLGCTVLSMAGDVLHEVGYGCGSCAVCSEMRIDHGVCIQAHEYGMTEAARFGGIYIYFCPMGLNFFVSPIFGQMSISAKVTVGPFLMVDAEDYVAYDLQNCRNIDQEVIDSLMPILEKMPYVSPNKVNALSTLLFMSVGFMNNVLAANSMLESRNSNYMQGQISDYILKLKATEETQYPFETERMLLSSIMESDKVKTQKLLNELLGYILFSSGYNFTKIRARVYELIVMLSRTAIDAGASQEYTFQLTHEFFVKSQDIHNRENLCYYMTKIANRLIDGIFSSIEVKNSDIIRKAIQYIRRNYPQKISLDTVAHVVDLSPSYFGKIFKKELNYNFNTFLNAVRIEKSMDLLLHEDLRLVNIPSMVGFADQSYFTKVFKRMTGVSPYSFRKMGGKIPLKNDSRILSHPLGSLRKII